MMVSGIVYGRLKTHANTPATDELRLDGPGSGICYENKIEGGGVLTTSPLA